MNFLFVSVSVYIWQKNLRGNVTPPTLSRDDGMSRGFFAKYSIGNEEKNKLINDSEQARYNTQEKKTDEEIYRYLFKGNIHFIFR